MTVQTFSIWKLYTPQIPQVWCGFYEYRWVILLEILATGFADVCETKIKLLLVVIGIPGPLGCVPCCVHSLRAQRHEHSPEIRTLLP